MIEIVLIVGAFFLLPRMIRSYQRRKANEVCPSHLTIERKVETLSEALRDTNEQRVLTALGILHESPELANQLISDLARCVQQQANFEMTRIACLVLGNCRASSMEAVSALSGVVTHTSEGIRRAAVWALQESRSPLTKDPLISALEDSVAGVRMLALMGLKPFAYRKDPSIVSAVVRGLDDPDQSVQREAAELAEKLGVIAKDAIPAMVRLLERTKLVSEGSNYSRHSVCKALQEMGALAQPAVPILIELHKLYGEPIELWIFDVFATIGSGAAAAVPTIVTALESPPKTTADSKDKARPRSTRLYTATKSLASIGVPAVPHLLEFLILDKTTTDLLSFRWQYDESINKIASTLSEIGGCTITPIIAKARTAPFQQQRGCIYSLGHFSGRYPNITATFQEISEAINFLKQIASDPQHSNQDVALYSLSQIALTYSSSLLGLEILEPILLSTAFSSPRPSCRQYAARTLALAGSDSTKVKLCELCADSDLEVAIYGLQALSTVAPERRSEHARRLLLTEKEDLRFRVVALLTENLDSAIIPVLISSLADPSRRIALSVLEAFRKSELPEAQVALTRFQDEQLLPSLLQKLRAADNNAHERRSAIWDLEKIKSVSAIPVLFDVLLDEDSDVRRSTMGALDKLLPDSNDYGRQFLDTLRQTKYSDVAEWTLRKVGKYKVPDSASSLIHFYSSSTGDVRRAAAFALGDLGSEAKPAVKMLIDGILCDDYTNASAAALIRIGDSAIPELVRALTDKKKRALIVSVLGEIKSVFSKEALKDHTAIIEESLDDASDEDLLHYAIGISHISSLCPTTVRAIAKKIKYSELYEMGGARYHIARALLATEADSDREAAISMLQNSLQDNSSYYRDEALELLSSLVPPEEIQRYTIKKLTADLESEPLISDSDQFEAAEELRKLATPEADHALSTFAKQKLPGLLASLEARKIDKVFFETHPIEAVGTLGKFGVAAAPILKELLETVDSERTKTQIVEALNKIQPNESESLDA